MKRKSPQKPSPLRQPAILSVREAEELAMLIKMPDSAIDLSDIPEIRDWSKAQVGRFYRPAS
jgi:hypothetical protein